jgi:hypothetical protein
MRSTTELRQHFVRERRAYEGGPHARQPVLRPAMDMLAGPPRERHVAHMPGKDKEREERLAAALRENLKRRKAHSRELASRENKEQPES